MNIRGLTGFTIFVLLLTICIPALSGACQGLLANANDESTIVGGRQLRLSLQPTVNEIPQAGTALSLDDKAVAPLPAAPPSILNVPVTIDLAAILKQVEILVPNSIDHSTEWEKRRGIYLKYKVWRDPLQVTVEGNKIRMQAHLYYNLRFADKVFGKYVQLGSCGVGEPAREAIITMESVLDWTEDWRLAAKTTTLPLDFPNRCEVTVLKFDITDLLQEQFAKQLQQAAQHMDAQVAKVDFREKVKQTWQMIEEPIRLGTENAWLVISPKAVALSPIQGAGQAVTLAVEITADPRVIVGAKPVTMILRLPPLTKPTTDTGFHLKTEGALSYEAASKLITNALSKTVIPVGNKSIKIDAVQVAAKSDKIVLTARTSGVLVGAVRAEGHIAFDPAGSMLTVSDLAISVESRNELAKYLADMQIKQFQEKWQDKAKWSLTDQIESLKQRITTAMNRTLRPGITLHGKVTALRALGLSTTQFGFTLPVLIEGVLSVDIAQLP